MANYSEAYDFNLFEDKMSNAVPVEEPKRREQERKNIIELPQKQLEKNKKPKRHPVQAIVAVMSFAIVLSVVTAVVYSQVRLTELTEQINVATQELAQEQSLEVQLTMQASQKMNGSEVEEYAKTKLGMSRISEGQIHYVNAAQEDKGVVLENPGEESLWTKMVNTVKSWFE